MTVDELIGRLRSLNVKGDTEVFVATDGEGTWATSGVEVRADEQDNYPADWNMPDFFVEITT